LLQKMLKEEEEEDDSCPDKQESQQPIEPRQKNLPDKKDLNYPKKVSWADETEAEPEPPTKTSEPEKPPVVQSKEEPPTTDNKPQQKPEPEPQKAETPKDSVTSTAASLTPEKPVVLQLPLEMKTEVPLVSDKDMKRRKLIEHLNNMVADKKQKSSVVMKSRSGKDVEINRADELISPMFGLTHNQRVKTPAGLGRVMGLDSLGMLWFKLDKDEGISFWDDVVDAESIQQKNITCVPDNTPMEEPDEEPKYDGAGWVPVPRPGATKPVTDLEALEQQLIAFAIRESELDIAQKKIQEYWVQHEEDKQKQEDSKNKNNTTASSLMEEFDFDSSDWEDHF